eukprot:1161194-Pelagomonas_calceolata.AAC.2
MVHACPYDCLAVLNLAAAVCVGPGLPICNFELELWIGLTRNRGVMSTAGLLGTCERAPPVSFLLSMRASLGNQRLYASFSADLKFYLQLTPVTLNKYVTTSYVRQEMSDIGQHMLQWTDYLGSPECAVACMDLLPSLDQTQMQLSHVNHFLSLPQPILSMSCFCKVEDVCIEWVLRAYGDASKVLADAKLLQQFKSLIFPAVKLYSERVQKNRINAAYLLASWVTLQDQQSNGHGPAQVAELFRCKDMNLLCTLPADAFAKVKPVCWKYLLGKFGDVYCIINEAALLSSFCSLEFALVEMWAGRNELAVHNENDVAVLLTFWCNGKSLSTLEEETLSGSLRVSQLSRSFRCLIVPKLAWFKPAFDLQVFNTMLDEESASLISQVAGSFHGYPPAWIALGRCGGLPADATKRSELTACFSQDTLGGMLAEAEQSNATRSLRSNTFYIGGFYWKLELDLNMPERSMGLYLTLSDKHPLPLPSAVKASYSLYHQGRRCLISTLSLYLQQSKPAIRYTIREAGGKSAM